MKPDTGNEEGVKREIFSPHAASLPPRDFRSIQTEESSTITLHKRKIPDFLGKPNREEEKIKKKKK